MSDDKNKIRENVNAVIYRKVIKGQTRVMEKVDVADSRSSSTSTSTSQKPPPPTTRRPPS